MSKKTSETLARVGLGLMVIGLACAHGSPPPQGAAERTEFVAQACPGVELGSEPLDTKNARLFVEVAELDTRQLPEPAGDWLKHNAVQVRSSANLVAFPNVASSMPWGQCVDAVCSAAKFSITVSARLPERMSEAVELSLRIERAAPEGSEGSSQVLLDTTLQARNQEPTVLPPAPQVSDGSLVVTTYLLRQLEDLQRVLACKMRQGEGESGQKPAPVGGGRQ